MVCWEASALGSALSAYTWGKHGELRRCTASHSHLSGARADEDARCSIVGPDADTAPSSCSARALLDYQQEAGAWASTADRALAAARKNSAAMPPATATLMVGGRLTDDPTAWRELQGCVLTHVQGRAVDPRARPADELRAWRAAPVVALRLSHYGLPVVAHRARLFAAGLTLARGELNPGCAGGAGGERLSRRMRRRLGPAVLRAPLHGHAAITAPQLREGMVLTAVQDVWVAEASSAEALQLLAEHVRASEAARRPLRLAFDVSRPSAHWGGRVFDLQRWQAGGLRCGLHPWRAHGPGPGPPARQCVLVC